MAKLGTYINGTLFTFDVDKVDGWDAIAYQLAVGGHLEDMVAQLAAPGLRVTAVEQSVVLWLWMRQNGAPNTSLRRAAEMVPLLAHAVDDEPAPVAAPDPEEAPDAPAPDPAPEEGDTADDEGMRRIRSAQAAADLARRGDDG